MRVRSDGHMSGLRLRRLPIHKPREWWTADVEGRLMELESLAERVPEGDTTARRRGLGLC